MTSPLLDRIFVLHGVLVALAAGLAWGTGALGAGSVLGGGVFMGANFWLLAQVVRRALGPGRRPGVAVASVLAKFLLFFGVLGLLFSRVPLDPLGFGVGALVLLVATVCAALERRVQDAQAV